MRKWLFVILSFILFSTYGFKSPDDTLYGTSKVLSGDTLNVSVSFNNPTITIKQVENYNKGFVEYYLLRQDSLLRGLKSDFDYISNNQQVIEDSTYVGYLSHSTEYSVGQINRFIREKYNKKQVKSLIYNSISLLAVVLFIILIFTSLDNYSNGPPEFRLVELSILFLLLLLAAIFIGNLVEILMNSGDVFRFEYLTKLLE